jgi:hypothetical protein
MYVVSHATRKHPGPTKLFSEEYNNHIGTKKVYMRSYNKKEKVVEKANAKYLSGNKNNPFCESSH